MTNHKNSSRPAKFCQPVCLLAISASLTLSFLLQPLLPAVADEQTVPGDAQITLPANTPDVPTALQGGVEMSHEEAAKYNLAAAKLRGSAKMTSDDYRALQVGVTGIELVRPYDKEYSTVEAVYPGCPAALAGIKVGELVVAGDPAQNVEVTDKTKPIWAFTGGKAGTTVTLKLLRKGEIVPITLTRMNVEDIPDANTRKTFEKMVKRLPASGEGTVRLPDQGAAPSRLPFFLRLALGLI